MLDHEAAALALRTRVRGVTAATTGTTSIAATANGYTRAAGSFLTDGFRVGMEVLASGFATSGNNGYKVITEVIAGAMTVASSTTMAVESAGGNELLLAGLPETLVWENALAQRSGVQLPTPTNDRPYVSDEWVPATHEQITFPANSGTSEETGLYVVTLFHKQNTGTAGLRAVTQAIAELFTPGTTVLAGSDVVRIEKRGARMGQVTPLQNGWAYCQLTIPWVARTTNLVAA